MKHAFKFSALALALLLLNACQDVVQVKLDQGSKLYVVDAFVNNLRGPQTIRISTNDNYFSNKETPPVPNASVVLKDLTNNLQYTFNYTTDGNYVYTPALTDTIGHVNHQYQLMVTIDGSTYTSLTVQKRPAAIDSIHVIYEDGNGGFGSSKPYYRCEMVAKDKADKTPDYYWIRTFRNDTLFNNPGDINLAIDGTGGEVTDFPLDSESFTPPSTFLGFKQYKLGDSCKVQIHSITRDTYNFLQMALNQITNGGLFALTPQNVKTNIVTPGDAKTKAVGWFSVASVVSKTRVIGK